MHEDFISLLGKMTKNLKEDTHKAGPNMKISNIKQKMSRQMRR